MRKSAFKPPMTANDTRRVLGGVCRNGRSEAGSVTGFNVFLFIILLATAGMAIDMIMKENRRVALQHAVDGALLSASSMPPYRDPERLVRDYVQRAGFDPDLLTLNGNNEAVVTENVVSLAGVLPTKAASGVWADAMRGSDAEKADPVNVEISLVLDISGSMNWESADGSSKIDVLKAAASDFVDMVFASHETDTVSISVVPYNQQVYAPENILARIDTGPRRREIENPLPFPGALTSFDTTDRDAPCLVFEDGDFSSLSLSASNHVTRASTFVADRFYWGLNGQTQEPFEEPFEWARWCGAYFPQVLALSNDPSAIETHIGSLTATGATAINVGLNWGLGLLDPSFRSVATSLIQHDKISASMMGRPHNYRDPGVQKYVILMSDGANTNQLDLKPEFKVGPTRAWFSPSAAEDHSFGGDTFGGYFVLMPDNDAERRWYAPGDPSTTEDDQFLSAKALPADAYQLDYPELYRRFGVLSAAQLLFEQSDPVAFAAHADAYEDVGGFEVADARLDQLCKLARSNDNVKIFTVAFEAPSEGQRALRDCAYSPGFHFDVDGTEIISAFRSIAGQIAVLNITE